MDLTSSDNNAPKSYADVSVAVIDDDVVITQLVERVLDKLGIGNVYRVTQSPRFLDMLAEGIDGLHLIICDYAMPHADGLQILRAVRATNPTLPFLMLTADGSGDTVKRAITGGVSGYIVKPLDINTLTEKVRTTLKNVYRVSHQCPESEVRIIMGRLHTNFGFDQDTSNILISCGFGFEVPKNGSPE